MTPLLLFVFGILAADQPKPIPVISTDLQARYWRARALMMDQRLKLANIQLLGAMPRGDSWAGADWNKVLADKQSTENAFNETLIAVRAICPIDEQALANDNILKCAKP